MESLRNGNNRRGSYFSQIERGNENLYDSRPQVEWESTIDYPISEEAFDRICKGNRSDWIQSWIVNYANGTRLAPSRHGEYVFQTKKTFESKNVLIYNDNSFYPMTRSKSTEMIENLKDHPEIWQSNAMIKTVLRFYKYVDNVRVSLNRETHATDGVFFFASFEVEYPENVTIAELCDYEIELATVAQKFKCIDSPQSLDTKDVFSIIPQKLQSFENWDPNSEYAWAFKWNGIRAKVVFFEHFVQIYPDSLPSETLPYRIKSEQSSQSIRNICFTCEILPEPWNLIIVLEVAGARFGRTLFSPEPITSRKFLDMKKPSLEGIEIQRGQNGYRLQVQTFHPSPCPFEYDETLHDGIVIEQRNSLIKWKEPTIDVLCVKKGKELIYVLGDGLQTVPISYPEGEPRKIYEIGCRFQILRERKDRKYPSTLQEYKEFLEAQTKCLENEARI